MIVTELTEEMKQVVAQEPRLKSYLKTLSQQRDTTERSWLYDGWDQNPFLEPDAVLAKWKKFLSSRLERGSRTERLIYEFDVAQEAKWGPQGGHPPYYKAMDVLTQGFSMPDTAERTPAFDSDEWKQAARVVRSSLLSAGVRNLRPATFEKVIDDLKSRDALDSKSGWPQNEDRDNPEVIERAIKDAKSGAYKTYPAIALFRYYNKKLRLVWMYAMAMNLVEGTYYQPLYHAIMDSKLADQFFCPWKGFDAVRNRITKAMRNGKVVSASDFSSTDAHFQKRATKEVYKVIEACFHPQFRAGLLESLMLMHEVPLVISEDKMIVGDHGVSSGSNWTNFIETIFDWIVCEYYHILNSDVLGLYAIGDDTSYISTTFWGEPFKVTLEGIGTSVGQEIKAEKTTSEKDWVKSLQRLFIRGYTQEHSSQLRGIYPTIRALKSSIYPERFHDPDEWDSDMFCIRQFMILENCVDHPLFNEFVAFICKGNMHLIPFAKMSRERITQAQARAKHLRGLNPTYNQEKANQSIADFASIRVAASL